MEFKKECKCCIEYKNKYEKTKKELERIILLPGTPSEIPGFEITAEPLPSIPVVFESECQQLCPQAEYLLGTLGNHEKQLKFRERYPFALPLQHPPKPEGI